MRLNLLRKFTTSRDPYQVLGVSKTATTVEIKQRFRELAKKFHPDLNSDKDASTKMAEIATAYDILSDPQKRASHESTSSTGSNPFSSSSSQSDWNDPSQMFTEFSNIFGRMNRARQATNVATKGDDLSATLEIDFIDSVKGSVHIISTKSRQTCTTCSGSGCKHGTSTSSCKQCKGTGTQRIDRGIMTMGVPCQRCAGLGQVIEHPCPCCKGEGLSSKIRDVHVKVPAGVKNFMELRIAGQGNAGNRGGRAGDLYVTVKVKPHPILRMIDDDVHVDVSISIKQALLGGSVVIPTVTGENQNLEISAKTFPGVSKILRGKGPPRVNGAGTGDMILHFVLKQGDLSAKQKSLIEEFDLIEQQKM